MNNEAIDELRDLVETIVFAIVQEVDQVEIEEIDSGANGIIFKITVDPSDTGKLIGKKGKIAESIRNLVRAAGSRLGVKASINVMKEVELE